MKVTVDVPDELVYDLDWRAHHCMAELVFGPDDVDRRIRVERRVVRRITERRKEES